MTRNERSGQALTEFLVGFATASVVFFAAYLLFVSERDRFVCADEVYRYAHAARMGEPLFNGHVEVREYETHLETIATCGRMREEVTLPHLEVPM